MGIPMVAQVYDLINDTRVLGINDVERCNQPLFEIEGGQTTLDCDDVAVLHGDPVDHRADDRFPLGLRGAVEEMTQGVQVLDSCDAGLLEWLLYAARRKGLPRAQHPLLHCLHPCVHLALLYDSALVHVDQALTLMRRLCERNLRHRLLAARKIPLTSQGSFPGAIGSGPAVPFQGLERCRREQKGGDCRPHSVLEKDGGKIGLRTGRLARQSR